MSQDTWNAIGSLAFLLAMVALIWLAALKHQGSHPRDLPDYKKRSEWRDKWTS